MGKIHFLGHVAVISFPWMAAAAVEEAVNPTAVGSFVAPDEESYGTRILRRSARIAAASGGLEEYDTAVKSYTKAFGIHTNSAIRLLDASVKAAVEEHSAHTKRLKAGLEEVTAIQKKAVQETKAQIIEQNAEFTRLHRSTADLYRGIERADSRVDRLVNRLDKLVPRLSFAMAFAFVGMISLLLFSVRAGMGYPSTPRDMLALFAGTILVSGGAAIVIFLIACFA